MSFGAQWPSMHSETAVYEGETRTPQPGDTGHCAERIHCYQPSTQGSSSAGILYQ